MKIPSPDLFHGFEDLNLYTIKVVPLPEGYSRKTNANLNEVIMTSLHGVIKWSHDGFSYFLIKY